MDSHDPQPHKPHLNPDGIPPAANVPTPGQPLSPSEGATDDDAPALEMTFSQWLKANRFMLLILVGLAIYLFRTFDLADIWSISKAVLGLSFVVFIHELGHFLVAKWCNVHVVTFSIGFGPALPGCKYKWGETTYMLALVPLGGYVQMVGQVDGDESGDGSDDDPRSYKNKTVWQRMAIISAGVIMNVILAFICFIIVYQAHGVDRQSAVVAMIDTGAPAYKHGLPSGAVIKEIGTVRDPHFEQLMYAVMNTGHGEKLNVVYQRDGGTPVTLAIEPRLEANDEKPMIGIAPPPSLELLPKLWASKKATRPVVLNSPAAKADAFDFGDRIIATTDPANPKAVKDLPLDPRKNDGKQRDYFEFVRRLRALAGQPVVIRVERTSEDVTKTVDIEVPPAYHATLGVRMKMGQVTAVRHGSEAEKKLKPKDAATAHEGDIIKTVEVREPDGRTTRYAETPGAFIEGPPERAAALVLGAMFLPAPVQAGVVGQFVRLEQPLDPVRLPDQLRDWARRMDKAGQKERTVTLGLRRHRDKAGALHADQTETLTWDPAWQDNNEVPMNVNSPLSIPGLGLAYRIKTTVQDVDGSVKSDLKAGDVIKSMSYSVATEEGKTEDATWTDLEADQWAHPFWVIQGYNIVTVSLKVERNGEVLKDAIVIEPGRVRDWPRDDRGLRLFKDQRRQKADNLIEAVGMGLNDTLTNMGQVYLNLKSIVTRRIDATKTLGGPLTIGVVAFRIAGIDFWQFVFFLGLISINLAVINFLPIPVLDGGHMVFLIYEKIRGKPASEGVRVGATYAGLLMLASLMIFVIFLDIKRFFF